MIRKLLVLGVLCAASGACSSSSSDSSGAQGKAGGTGSGSCPDVSGSWEITAHCKPEFIGLTLQVTENACVLSFAQPFDGFSGSVTQDGKITLSGPQNCTGTATTSDVSMNCTSDTPDPCLVKLAR